MSAGAADLTKRRVPAATPFRAVRDAAPPGQAPRTDPLTTAVSLCIAWRIGLPARAHEAATELRWTIRGDLASAALHSAGVEDPQPLAEARLTRRIRDARAGLEHFEVDGLLWLTVRDAGNNPPTLLFARTTLFTRLNILGGRYAAPRLL